MNDTGSLISPATRPGYVALTVADLEEEIAFYRDVLGMAVQWKQGTAGGMGAGAAEIVRLVERKGAPRVRHVTGLYHMAILLPSRKELARMIARLYTLHYRNAPTDHTVSQSTYLSDPEGNGIELYADTPWAGTLKGLTARDKEGNIRSASEPLDIEALFNELAQDDDPGAPMAEATRLGHVHLHVSDLDAAMRFYAGVIGFTRYSLQAEPYGFGDVGVPGYNVHMIAFNIWAGNGAPAPPPGSRGLLYYTLNLPDRAEVERVAERVKEAGVVVESEEEGVLVRDPAGNGVMMGMAGSPSDRGV